MVWVSVDGLEGAGKTTLVRSLSERFSGTRLLPEFSASFAGRALASAVKVTPHYVSHSVVAQSLFFLGEYVEKIEEARSEIDNACTLVLSDRGLLSKIAYQGAVLRPVIGSERTDALLSICLAELPVPDVTIWLRIDPEIAKTRVECRGAPRNTFNLGFMKVAAAEFERAANKSGADCLDASVMSARQVCDAVKSIIIAKWPVFLPDMRTGPSLCRLRCHLLPGCGCSYG